MCTAISDGHLFGRTLDLEYSYNEKIVILPRNYGFTISGQNIRYHPAMIGVAHIANGYPLYYDAINEHGLGVAGLNFPGNAVYTEPKPDKHNVPSFELIPWLLSKCDSTDSAEKLLCDTVITNTSFSPDLPPTPLHWIIADKNRAITVEQTKDGLNIFDNTPGVMTNSPVFPYHLLRVADYMSLDSAVRENTLCQKLKLEAYSRGMSAMGLPGDYSSSSRFVRAVFAKFHTTQAEDWVNRFFHVMDTVSVPKGCVKTDSGKDVYTVYTSCADLESLVYYFKTYDNPTVRGVRLTEALANAGEIISFPMNSDDTTAKKKYSN